MELHRKFTFDDPEDSYWNDNDSQNSFFEDHRNASVARQVLDDLYEADFDIPEEEAPDVEDNASNGITIKQNEEVFDDIPKINFNERLQKPQLAGKPVNESPRPRRALGSSSMISDCSFTSFSSDATVHLDYSRLKSEHHKLQKYLDKVRAERFEPPSVETTIKRLKRCDPVALDFYKSKQDKVELLDEAINSRDNDVILTVVLFLKKTLIVSIFREILIFKPEAAEVYITYLRESNDTNELIDTLFSLGRSDEAAMVEFSCAIKKCHTTSKINSLKKCLISGFSDPTLNSEAKFVDEYIRLIERQVPIDAADEEESKSGSNEIFKQYPKKATLIGQPLLTTLYYCCLYHYNLPINVYASPLSFKATFNINEKAYFWMAASALSRKKQFTELEKLLICKKMIVAQKLVCPFPWTVFFQLVVKYGPPSKEILSKWLNAVGDVDERLNISEQFGDLTAAVQIDAIISLKDKQKLVNLMNKLNPKSVEYNKAQLILANTANKWKT
ncbi:unnamed protein product [Bursaphelenchus okinawaensis]|uniref:Vps16 C-terminal domain-containing protein n=1 Tax=Bursaphelenchus okinawaensis TaxID=465554 RepID=A0A811L7P7_9BILA|nr:unnamed protein product [Bursaphelenchus okinawaensis]CAG9118589.1 unnamed protein product [Bursaphelenchus okinawaensis]